MRHPSGIRAHVWLCRPRTTPPVALRSNSSVMLAKSRPKLTMSSRFTVRARLAAGRATRNHFWIVNRHEMGNSSRAGRMLLLIAAVTVCTGSFTSWLKRSRIATLHSM